MSLLDSTIWNGRLFSNGWQTSTGGTAPVTEPATADQIGELGVADGDDVSRACRTATETALWEQQHAPDVESWLVREAGSTAAKAQVETHAAAQECYQAAIAASLPYGRLLASTQSPYGLSLGVVTGDVMRGWDVAQRIPSGIVHVNDQSVNDEATAPFGGVGDSGTGSRFGGAEANIEAFTEASWVTMRGTPPAFPF